jgi:hypothetical protein
MSTLNYYAKTNIEVVSKRNQSDTLDFADLRAILWVLESIKQNVPGILWCRNCAFKTYEDNNEWQKFRIYTTIHYS